MGTYRTGRKLDSSNWLYSARPLFKCSSVRCTKYCHFYYSFILFNVQADSMDINTRFLQLFILPVAPLLLSIYYEMMSTNRQTDNLLDTYRKNLTHKTLPISTYFYTQTQVQDMLNLNLIPQYD